MKKESKNQSLDIQTFKRFRRWYFIALAAIAISLLIAQIFIQVRIESQLSDARIINIAGRQRALSQKLVKEALLLKEPASFLSVQELVTELQKTVVTWKQSFQNLQYGNRKLNIEATRNPEILLLYEKIIPYYQTMSTAANYIIKNPDSSNSQFSKSLLILLRHERTFLQLMDQIVLKYDQLSTAKLRQLQRIESILMIISLLILLSEILFIFNPISVQIRNTIADLLQRNREVEATSMNVQTLFSEKEKSLKELQELMFVIDNVALFASARRDGSIVFISKKFLELLGVEAIEPTKTLSDVMTADAGQQQYLKEVLKGTRKNVVRKEEIEITTPSNAKIWLDMSIVDMHTVDQEQSVLILCSDITERKANFNQVAQLKEQNFEQQILQKKIQASQIVEGQEEERKRIAKDIHDGIGQMLTALKFNIESIDVTNQKKLEEKILYIKDLTADLIKGVRAATFNLTPPELSDHGIFPALQKMVSELNRLTGKNILFENKSEHNARFDSLAETNIYRVTQEAINNAIKYADADYIMIVVKLVDTMLSITISDNGKGFDTSKEATKLDPGKGGMGLHFMKERMNYIDGKLFIHSSPGEGTRITINYKYEA